MPVQSPSKSVSKPVAKKPATAPAKKAAPTAKPASAAKPAAQQDNFQKGKAEPKERSSFGGFMDSFKGGLGQLNAASKPLDFSAEDKKEGLEAAGTMDRLAGKDGTWDGKDLANNFAQLPTSKGILGGVKDRVVQGKLFDQHKVPEQERGGIVEQSRQIKKDNPSIEKMRQLENMDTSGFDEAKRAKYDQLSKQYSGELSEKGLMPVSVPDLQQMGSASEVLQDKLRERGLPVPEGGPVNAGQYRGLFEGKSPARTQLGF